MTKSRVDTIRAQIARMQEHRAAMLAIADQPWSEGNDWIAVAGAQAEASALTRTIKALQAEFEAAINAESWANQTPADVLARARKRSRLIDDLCDQSPTNIPLMVAERETMADLILDLGLDLQAAYIRMKEETTQ